jgi:hypothetical protein
LPPDPAKKSITVVFIIDRIAATVAQEKINLALSD